MTFKLAEQCNKYGKFEGDCPLEGTCLQCSFKHICEQVTHEDWDEFYETNSEGVDNE